MILSLVVAVADNDVIGLAGDLPWRLRTDLRRFRELTWGRTVIVGRRTHDAIVRRLGGPLPGRRTIVLSRRRAAAEGCAVAASWEEALALVQGEDEVFVIGGAEVYRLALPYAQRIYRSRVHAAPDGDTVFPELDPAQWRVLRATAHPRGAGDDFDHTFEILERAAVPVR
ncbi:MAG: dihydrofolate reductase [Armatimonadota bacterium]|nr:dihydrofolate reductase [Armatimonadota bacterium]MDR7451852.1 dihydrofolate reductase [Armatimonadota bacterium]MDR7467577.1 dihydrofolate reductase [Armatimonadota bacterium]MDR7494462.1 dihydrofolate reductase [Armatimonadota bacterium]MDR7499723.1 dihydrofolate reductase [Armatimonadota bacterium]